MKRNTLDKDGSKSTKALEKVTIEMKDNGVDDGDGDDQINHNDLYIPLTEDNIDSYFEDENYVQKMNAFEHLNKLNKNEEFNNQINNKNKVQQFFFNIVTHYYFELFMTLLIIFNSILTALTDYSQVDDQNNLLNTADRNAAQLSLEPMFLAFFTLEMIMKMIAYGFFGTNSYFKDGWNLLDGFVVVIGLLSLSPQIPNLNIVRTFRCFRSLKLAAVSPTLKNILNNIVASILNLGDVLGILVVVMLFFSIVGLHVFSGPYTHSRCRLTPYPVNTSWYSGKDFAAYRCLNVDNYNLIPDQPDWTKESSPWRIPQSDCYWPVDDSDEQLHLCSFGAEGSHQCHHSSNLAVEDKRWCGSNYDARGNPRFVDYRLMKSETYNEKLSWGYINYDNIVLAFIAVFQVTSLNGWSGFMYRMQDSLNSSTPLYFIALFLVCNFLIVNLVLAIWNSNSFSNAKVSKEKKVHGPLYKFWHRYHNYLVLKEQGEVPEEFSTNTDGSPWPTSVFYRIMSMSSKTCYKVMYSSYCQRFFELTVMFNAGTLMANYYPAPPLYLYRLELINFILTIAFVIELILKIAGLGLGRFIESKLRLMDASITFLCIFSSMENLPWLLGYQFQNTTSFTTEVNAFRAFRILRVLTIIQGFPALVLIVKKILKSVRSTMAFAVIINLFIYTMALIGMTFFANNLVFDKDGYVITSINSDEFREAKKVMPRSNFDNFLFSFATVFQIMTTEDWNSVQNNLWRSVGMPAILFPWIVIVFGVFILLSLYVGQIIDDFSNFENDVEDSLVLTDDNEEEKHVETQISDSDVEKGLPSSSNATDVPQSIFSRLDFQSPKNPFYAVASAPIFDQLVLSVIILSAITLALDSPLENPDLRISGIYNQIGDTVTVFFICESIIKILGHGPTVYFKDGWNIFDFSITLLSAIFIYYNDPRYNSLRSFRVFRVLRPLRLLSQLPGLKLVINSLLASVVDAFYSSVILMMIWLIFGTVAVTYLKGQMRSCTGAVFVNTIATNPAYFELLQYPIPWDQMDYDQKDMFGPSSKVYVGNTTFLSTFCGDWPVNPCCQGNSLPTSGALTSRQLCECWGGIWDFSSGFNFDNIGNALIALFSIATTEGWVRVMYQVVDTNGIDMEPIRDNHIEWIVAFLFFMMIGSFLGMNIFVGVIVDAYTRSYKNLVSPLDSLMTPEQQEWVRELDSRTIIDDNYREEKESIIQKDIHETFWARVTVASIFANTCCLTISYFGEPSSQTTTLMSLRLLFSLLFLVEKCHIVYVKGVKVHVRELINIIDFFVVVINFAGCIKSYYVAAGPDFYVISSFRMFVGLNMLMNMYPTYFGSLKRFARTIVKAVPAFMNIGCLVLLFLFIWALVGVNNYSKVAFYGSHNEDANFRTVQKSFLTIIRFLTGGTNTNTNLNSKNNTTTHTNANTNTNTKEGWAQFMYDLSKQQPDCVADPPYNSSMCGFTDSYGCIPMNGCGGMSTFPFFFTFEIFCAYITLNLTIAVILENYLAMASTRGATINVIVRAFVTGWLNYDPMKKCYISFADLERFAVDICNPYSFPPGLPTSKVRQRIVDMQIRCFLGKGCYLRDVLDAFQVDYKKYNSENIADPNLSVMSIAESITLNLDQSGDQSNNFLRSYYFNKSLTKEINVSLASMKLKKNKKISIQNSLYLFERFQTSFYASRAFLVWKNGPSYDPSALWPKSARPSIESNEFMLFPYSNAISGLIGSWFTYNATSSSSNSSGSSNGPQDEQSLGEIAPNNVDLDSLNQPPKKKRILKKKKKVPAAGKLLDTVPEDSGDDEGPDNKLKKKVIKEIAGGDTPKPIAKKR